MVLLRFVFSDRKGKDMFKLSKLSADKMQIKGNFHEAMFDVQVLETLCNKYVPVNVIEKYVKSFEKTFNHEKQLQVFASNLPDLAEIKKLTNAAVCKKLILLDINYSQLKNLFISKGTALFREFLSEKDGRSARVTANVKYIENLVNHFSK